MRHFLDRVVSTRLLPLVLSAGVTLGCTSGQVESYRLSKSTVSAMSRLAADSGVSSDGQTLAKWQSVVAKGRLVAVEERFARFGATGVRRYEYDSAGVLRQMTEQLGGGTLPWSELPPLDAPEATQLPVRISRVAYAADGPVYAARHRKGQPLGYGRREMYALQVRGYALRDAALRALTPRDQKKK